LRRASPLPSTFKGPSLLSIRSHYLRAYTAFFAFCGISAISRASMLKSLRKWHRGVSILIAIPVFITLVTGLLLSTRGFNTWVQPAYPPFQAELKVNFDQILKAAQSVPPAKIASWNDVTQIDIRPGKGNIRVRSKNNWEVQINGSTGAVTQAGPRRVSWLMSLHEGASFGPLVRYGVFFPSAVALLFLLLSGVVLFFQPVIQRRKGASRFPQNQVIAKTRAHGAPSDLARL